MSEAENADCNTSGNGAYDVEVVKSTTGDRAVGFTVGVGRACVEVGGSLVGVDAGVGMGPSSVGVDAGVGMGPSSVGVGDGVGPGTAVGSGGTGLDVE